MNFEGLSRQLILGGNEFTIATTQDVSSIIERNKAAQNEDDKGWYTQGTRAMKWVGSIPFVVAEIWRNEKGIDVFNPNHGPAVRRLLNDPDWRWLRVGRGRLNVNR
jgi:hypothetical protein